MLTLNIQNISTYSPLKLLNKTMKGADIQIEYKYST